MASKQSSHAYVSTQPQDWSEPYAHDPSANTAPPFSFQAKERSGKKTSVAGSLLGRLLFLVAGIVLLIVGLAMLILPGPGLLVIGIAVYCFVRAVKGPSAKGRRKA